MARRLAALIAVAILASGAVRAAEASDKKLSHGLYESEVISAEQLKRLLNASKKPVVFDARSVRSFETAHIAGARLPRSQAYYDQLKLFEKGIVRTAPDADLGLKEGVRSLDRRTPIVTYCSRHCSSSSVLLFRLKGLGFTDVRSMEEGFETWEAKGYPVERSSA